MDLLILDAVVVDLNRSLAGASLSGLTQDGADRFRFVFESADGGIRSVLVSLQPERPWIGRPSGPPLDRKFPAGRFASFCRRELAGAVLAEVRREGAGRLAILSFADGHELAVELAPRQTNLVLLDARGQVVTSARRPRRSSERVKAGIAYEPPGFPGGRPLLGVSRAAAAWIEDEACRSGREPGDLLAGIQGEIAAGARLPVISATFDLSERESPVDINPEDLQLLPWEPENGPAPGQQLWRGQTAAETAGRYHELVERIGLRREHHQVRLAILRRELRRAADALTRAGVDAASFVDPGRYQRWGEALLAGATVARREGDSWVVPDPYAASGAELAIAAPGGSSVHETADDCFRRHRRAVRGIERAATRVRTLTTRRDGLARLLERLESLGPAADPTSIDAEFRELGLAVGLEPAARSSRKAAVTSRPRLEGVRVFTSTDGSTILAGKTGRDNHRLTFKLAAPEDLWFHVQGQAGAHVVLRREGGSRPAEGAMREAAAVAAWFSGARTEARVDVQWCLRKHVRRPRGAAPGTVVLKRFETLRVRPGLPADRAPI